MFVCHSQAFAFSRKCKQNRNPFALFLMDSQVFVTVGSHWYGIHKALLFSVFLPTSHIIFGNFVANFKSSYSQGYSPRCESSIRSKIKFYWFAIALTYPHFFFLLNFFFQLFQSIFFIIAFSLFEPPHDKTNKMTVHPV